MGNSGRQSYTRILFTGLLVWSTVLVAKSERTPRRNSQKNVFLACIPKSGSHMIKKCVGMMGHFDFTLPGLLLTPSANVSTHRSVLSHSIYNEQLAHALRDNEIKVIFLLRDPRDQAVSFIHFAHKNPKAWPALSSLSFNDALTQWISNTSHMYSTSWSRFKSPELLGFKGIDDFYGHYLEWVKQPNVYTARFENLVGSRGGGSDALQMEEITNIANFLELDLSQDRIDKIAEGLFGSSRTFRSGKIGSWRTHFTPEHKELFKKVAGQLLIDLGYEKDMNW